MSFINYLKKVRDTYVINQVQRLKIPQFEPSPLVRQRLIFSGRVQKVGFRLAVYELAKRLKVSGWVKNRDDKKVEAEIQGEIQRIDFLIRFLLSLKRASIKEIERTDLVLLKEDNEFHLIK